ncbi:uncharacterized protein LOC131663744 isoform X2 [Phymastichus coffea]|uniref:uncharacterized protein LOC131663744 isoform X2 n=1 Tax=Phymastichus coffea TaxID=108790 RepID=UPI00273CAC84|nr:uncharacterized protein LOC131663744 isoform X2 [Phymastichus coffea]
MKNFRQIKITFLLLILVLVILVRSQEAVQNNKKNISLHDPNVDETVKSALENGSVSEVVVRKDLLLFPVNAPNLVIAHTQEIHAVPQSNGTNTTDRKPTAAEVAEVNEYSLSQLVSTNDTNYDNETVRKLLRATASTLLRGPENVSVLEPGKLLEIVSGFNLSHGLATETVPLPNEVQNISLPKQSIAGLLSKSLQQSDSLTTVTIPAYDFNTPQSDVAITDITSDSHPYADGISKRSADLKESNSSSDGITVIPPYPYIVKKRQIDSDENDSDDDSISENNTTEEIVDVINKGNSTEPRSIDSEMYDNDNNGTITEETAENGKRSVKEDDSLIDNSSFSTVEYDSTSISSTMLDSGVKDNYKVETINNSTAGSRSFVINNGALYRMHTVEEKLKDDSPEDMEVAEDIVFRPLFRYRQETRLRQQSSRRSGYRQSAYKASDTQYDDD